MNFEFERVFFEAKYSHRIFLNKFTKNFHNYPLAELSQCILDSSNGPIINVI